VIEKLTPVKIFDADKETMPQTRHQEITNVLQDEFHILTYRMTR